MKRLTLVLILSVWMMWSFEASAQNFRNDYYDARRAAHTIEGLQANAIVFVGNSITEQGWWRQLFKRTDIENRGIGGDNTCGMIDRLPQILESRPRAIFLMAGINDLTAGQPIDTVARNILRIAQMIHASVPECKLYIQSVLPVNDKRLVYAAIRGKNPSVKALNIRLRELCGELSWCYFVDIAPLLSDLDGELRADLTKDGIHLHPEAYVIWANYLKKLKYIK